MTIALTPFLPDMLPHPSQPEPAHRQHQRRLVDKLTSCLQSIKAPGDSGGGFRSFGDFITGLFGKLQTDASSASDGAYQTVNQTARAFLKSNSLKTFLDNLSSHPAMITRDANLQGVVPNYSVSPALPVSQGTIPFFHADGTHLMFNRKSRFKQSSCQ